MNSSEFENENLPRWQRLEEMIEGVEKRRTPENVEELPTLFRQTCHDLSIAQHRIYGMGLVERLNSLAIRGFRTLERRIGGGWESLFRMMLVKFPKMVRAEWRLFWFCSLIFWGPFLALAIWTPHDAEWAMSLLGPQSMVNLESMYGEHTSPQDFLREEYGSDFMMFCFYIYNTWALTCAPSRAVYWAVSAPCSSCSSTASISAPAPDTSITRAIPPHFTLSHPATRRPN